MCNVAFMHKSNKNAAKYLHAKEVNKYKGNKVATDSRERKMKS